MNDLHIKRWVANDLPLGLMTRLPVLSLRAGSLILPGMCKER